MSEMNDIWLRANVLIFFSSTGDSNQTQVTCGQLSDGQL